jgi:hypothetical protein
VEEDENGSVVVIVVKLKDVLISNDSASSLALFASLAEYLRKCE